MKSCAFTVLLTAKANGHKCLPFVLLPRKRPVADVVQKFSGKLVLSWSGQIWMNDKLTEEYLHKTFGPQLFSKRVLIWNSFQCHLSEATRSVLKSLKIDTIVVPGGCTKFVQPADVSWNCPFKEAIQDFHNVWISRGDLPCTAGGNPKPRLLMCIRNGLLMQGKQCHQMLCTTPFSVVGSL